MAISRSIISWDLFFQAKDYTEIYRMLVTNYKAIYGSDINLAINTADGEFIRTLAVILYDFSKLASDTYNSIDINNAKGKLLDNLVLLSGNLIRKKDVATEFTATLSWDGGNIDYSTSDIIIAEDIDGNYWEIIPVDEVTQILSAGTLVTMKSQSVGEYNLPIEDFPIREIRKNANYVSAEDIELDDIILNIRGSVAETDAHLKARKKESLSFNSTSLIDSIRDEVLNNIYSVDDIKIYSSVVNGGLTIPLWNGTALISGGVTIPKHDVFVLVKPQEDVNIVQNGVTSKAIVDVLKRKITLGISTFQTAIGIQNVTSITIGLFYRIETLGDTDWNTVFGTTGVTYSDGDTGIAIVVGTGTGTVSDANYKTEVIELDSVFPGYIEIYRYYISQPYNPHIRINYTSTNSGFNEAATLTRIREALYKLAKDYPINRNISTTEVNSVAFNAGNLDPLNPTFVIDSIWIKFASAPTSSSSEVTVNNGYWYVNGLDDVKITLVVTP
jgi:hypothetical protein